ncbi:MAG: hypothetical protein PUF72_06745 [Clostridiales bacterium]|nr:hypothetical protein [Clostridiales bacterium]
MKLKKLSFLPALAILVTSLTLNIPVNAADKEDKYGVLCGLGFFEKDAVYSETAPVTIGDIAQAIVNALPEDRYISYKSGDTGFSDIDESDPMAAVAYNAHILGLLGDEKEFKSDKTATTEDASKMILNLLGYGKVANGAYARYASEVGLTKNMPQGTGFNEAGLTAMLYNALDIELMQWVPEGAKEKYTTVKGETYMTKILDAGKGKGLVNANQFTGLSGEKIAGVGDVKIDGELYKSGTLPADSYLGNLVEFYYRNTDDDQKQLVYIRLNKEDSVLEFDAENIVSFEDMTYTYETGPKLDRKRTAQVAADADVIYNGKALDGDFDCYTPEQGSIKLINNDGNSEYEIVIITDYDVVTVSTVDKTKGIISSKYSNKEYKVDLYAQYPSYQVILADGTVKKLSDITKYSTVFIAQSMDKTVTTIIMSEKQITGSVESYTDDTVVIAGITYDVTPDFLKYNTIKPLSYGTFYLDPKGRIGYYDAMNGTDTKAGYLVKFGQNTDTGEDNMLYLKIFTENGKMEVYSTASKYYYTDGNGSLIKKKANNAREVLDALEYGKSDELGGGQLILYKLNSDGFVSEIEIAAKNTDDLAVSDTLDKSGILRQMTAKNTQTHKGGQFLLSARYKDNVKVFKIPSDLSKSNMFAAYSGMTNCFEWNKEYTYVPFAKTVNAEAADYVLAFLSGGGTVDKNTVFAVEDVLNSINSDNEPVKLIKGLWGTTSKSFMLDEATSENDINSGDILRLGFDDAGNVNALEKAFDIEKRNVGTNGSLTEEYYAYVANAYDFKGNTLRVTTKDPLAVVAKSELINTFTDVMPQILHYNADVKKFEVTDYTSIKTYKDYPDSYSTVFAWFRYADHKMMVVYD